MRRNTLAALALIPVLAFGLPGCGGDGGKKAAGKSDSQKMREYAQCMRANGIDMKDPDGGRVEIKVEGKEGGEKMKAAEAKCRHLMPNGGKPPKPNAKELAQLRALAKCMRGQGIDMPDPNPDGGILQQRKEGDRGKSLEDDKKMKAAEKACSKYLPKNRMKERGNG